jgi:hypothetical protein
MSSIKQTIAWREPKGPPVAQPSIPARPRAPASKWPPQAVAPEAAVTMVRDYIRNVPVTHYYSWTLPPGLPPRGVQPRLELCASKVISIFS